MIPKTCKRLAEVDFPIAEVSKHALTEKGARCGHIPKIHVWPANRPTASGRAVLMALLLPDPADEECPAEFKTKAREVFRAGGPMTWPGGWLGEMKTDEGLRKVLLKFIADFANWDNSAVPRYLETARALVKAAHPEETPLVVDPFAGGGSIPLEALRIGCEAFASDLNPLACLISKVVLEDIPRAGQDLADELADMAERVKSTAARRLVSYYPRGPDGAEPVTYLWARTVRCEAPKCGAEIPLVRSFWLSKKRKLALRYEVKRSRGRAPHLKFAIVELRKPGGLQAKTVDRAKARCPCCGSVLPAERTRAQLSEQRGGADVIFDGKGNRTGGALMTAVVTLREGKRGRHYRLPTARDYEAVWKAQKRLKRVAAEKLPNGLSLVPGEPTPAGGGSGAGRAFSVQSYGMMEFGDLFTSRQKVALSEFARLVRDEASCERVAALAALCVSKMVDMNNALATWQPHAEIPAHMLTRFAIPMKWDFAEAVPISDSSGTLTSAVTRALQPFTHLTAVGTKGSAQIADATSPPLPQSSCDVWFTDPPYYDAVPYSGISDFFLAWLRRCLPDHPLLDSPLNADDGLSPKTQEIVQDETQTVSGRPKDRFFFEDRMALAFAKGRRVLRDDGIGAVVFAHKTTEGWEALLSGMTRGGWVITGSWPLATEMSSRLRARESAALATSVHLVCRPRDENAGVGDWADVLRELPHRVGDWMERLQGEGVRGADLVFACIGPALEIFSKYERVETPEGREVPLGEYLEKVWEAVGRAALGQVLGTAEAKARNSAAGALEEDARLTALFLWTLQSTGNGKNAKKGKAGDDGDEAATPKKSTGYSLIFDVVRRFAQPLGIHLEDWEGRIIRTEKGVVRLLPVSDRAEQLFGEAGADAVAARLQEEAAGNIQMMLLPQEEAAPRPKGRRKKRRRKRKGAEPSDAELLEARRERRREATTLDRVHAAMLLQAGGRYHALRALIKTEQDRGPDFLRLANALSALYPAGSEEKRLVDAMLLAAPR